MGIKFDDEVLGLWLLNTLLDSWETFRVSITNSSPDGVVSFENVKSSVLNEEMRRKAHGTSSYSEVFVTENRGRSQKKEPKGSKQNNISKSKSRYKNVECHYCLKTGQFRKIVFFGKRRTRIRKGRRRRNIMTMMIVLLLLFVMMILLFSVTMIQLILYQMRSCG